MSFTVWFDGIDNKIIDLLCYDLYTIFNNKYNFNIVYINFNEYGKLLHSKNQQSINSSISITTRYLNNNKTNTIIYSPIHNNDYIYEIKKSLQDKNNKFCYIYCKSTDQVLDDSIEHDLVINIDLHNRLTCITNILLTLNNKQILKGIL